MELAESISVLHLGRTLAEGTPAAIARDADVQRVYLGGR
jgi:ABC-type branched-subunit amino acid transport system ATPase component